MSVAFRSGTRLRSVDVSIDDGDEIPIDGTRLRQERIERSLSVTEAARLATLSREQVEQIESGGLGAFYGARHKLLAVRKYADSFGLSLEQLSASHNTAAAIAADPVPISPPAFASVAGTDAGTAEEAATSVVPASEPEIETAPETAPETEPLMRESPVADGDLPVAAPPSASATRWPLVLVVGITLLLTFAILRGLTREPSPAESPPAEMVPALPSSAVQAAAESQATAQVQVTDASEAVVAVANDACALVAGPDTPRWTTGQARNASPRVFLTSASPIDVCVTDAAGVSTPLTLKPGAMSSASGKPPYIVRSERLSQAQIFLQGVRVRVPASATALHLLPSQFVRAKEASAGTEN